MLVGPVDDEPRRATGAGPPYRTLGGACDATVQAQPPPLPIADPPPRQRVAPQRPHPLVLGLGVEVQPDLQDERPSVGEHLLQRRDALQATVERRLAGLPLHPIRERRLVPGAVKQTDLALRRQRTPIPPERRALELLVGRRTPGAGDNPARIHPFVEQVPGRAPAGRIDACQHDDHRERLLLPERLLHLEQRLPDYWRTRLVLVLGNRRSALCSIEHPSCTRHPCRRPYTLPPGAARVRPALGPAANRCDTREVWLRAAPAAVVGWRSP